MKYFLTAEQAEQLLPDAAQRTERTICSRMHKEMRRNSDICRQGQSDRNMEQEGIKCAYFQPNR